VSDSPSLWELRRKTLLRARKRWRAGEESGLHDFRVSLRRLAATAGALGREKVERRARKMASSLADDRQLEIDRALLARVREMGLVTEDSATALQVRWEASKTDPDGPSARDRKLRKLSRKLRSLARDPESIDVERLLEGREAAEASLRAVPMAKDDRALHRYRLRVKRARYLAEDLVACGRREFESAAVREKTAQDSLGRWNDLRLFLERIDEERTLAERRGAVKLAAELGELRRLLDGALKDVRRSAVGAARGLSIASAPTARSA
jgi:CHAD domain-containing protein